MQKKTTFRILMRTALVVYIVLMIGLLYGKGIISHPSRILQAQEIGYWMTVRRYTNTVPLKTILPFLRMMRYFSISDFLTSQTVGNVLIFMPFGFFIPYYRRKKQKLLPFSMTCLCLIILIESTQVLTLFGSFDVDDIILNMVGCLAGFFVFRMFAGCRRMITDRRCGSA